MTIEYAVLDLKKDKKKIKNLEEYLNLCAKRGWRIKCSIGTKLILMRKIRIE